MRTNVCGLRNAKQHRVRRYTSYPVIYKLRTCCGVDTIGRTMRLGAYPADLKEDRSPTASTTRPVIFRAPPASLPNSIGSSGRLLTEQGSIISGVSPTRTSSRSVRMRHPWFHGCTELQPEIQIRKAKQ